MASAQDMLRGRQASALGGMQPRHRTGSRRLSDKRCPNKQAPARRDDRCPGVLREGDPVQVFSRTADKWVEGEIVKFVEDNFVRVEYAIGCDWCGKTLHLHDDHLVISSFPGVGRECDPGLAGSAPKCQYPGCNGPALSSWSMGANEFLSCHWAHDERPSRAFDEHRRRSGADDQHRRRSGVTQQERARGAMILQALPCIQVVPFGVLGSRLSPAGLERYGFAPDHTLAFVDPAGLHYIQRGGPSGAGGASGAAYQFLQIDNDKSFPPDVQAAITKPGDAKYHQYTIETDNTVSPCVNCIHVVGPNFNEHQYDDCDETQAIQHLAHAYHNVFVEFAKTNLQELRLLPISGAIFAGRFLHDMPTLSARAMFTAFFMVKGATLRQRLLQSTLQLCIFERKDFLAFEAAVEREESVLIEKAEKAGWCPTTKGSMRTTCITDDAGPASADEEEGAEVDPGCPDGNGPRKVPPNRPR